MHRETEIPRPSTNYADFHLATVGMTIVHKDTGQKAYKPSFFHTQTPQQKLDLLNGKHTDYSLQSKYSY